MQEVLQAYPNTQLSPAELASRLKLENPPVLLDVRELQEYEIVRLPDGQLLTQELLEEVRSKWPKDRDIVTYCHHGIRSLHVAMLLIDEGFVNVQSLTGGIDAWALEVDSSLVRY